MVVPVFDNQTDFGLVEACKAVYGPDRDASVRTSDGFGSGALSQNREVFIIGSARTPMTVPTLRSSPLRVLTG